MSLHPRRFSRTVLFRIGLAVAFVLSMACASHRPVAVLAPPPAPAPAPPPPPPPPKAAPPREFPPLQSAGPPDLPVITYRGFLKPGDSEQPGLALYSYLLFEDDNTDSNRDLRIQLLKAFLEISIAPPAPGPAHQAEIPLSQRNVLFAPVDSEIGACGEKPSPDCVLRHYDLNASRSLLLKLDAAHVRQGGHSRGQYLISLAAPVGRLADGNMILDWDLYRLPPDIAALKLDLFKEQVRGPIPAPVQFLNSLMLALREGIGEGALLLAPATAHL